MEDAGLPAADGWALGDGTAMLLFFGGDWTASPTLDGSAMFRGW